MLNKKHFSKIRNTLLDYSEKRREIIKLSGDAGQRAKKSIFAKQRDDDKLFNEHFSTSFKLLKELEKLIKKNPKLKNEGSYKAALEEYIESAIFTQCLNGEEIGDVANLEDIDPNIYISGLCDVPGELYRYAIKSATNKDFDKVKVCHKYAESIIMELLDMDLTGYNRQKFDQAKQALRKLEQIIYEVSMKRN